MNKRAKRETSAAAAIVVVTLLVLTVLSLLGSSPAGEDPGVRSLRISAAPEPEPDSSGVLPSKGKFLVASRTLVDPRFQETVVLLIDYSTTTGATGLIINRPTRVSLAELLPSVQGLKKRTDVAYYGGPVEGYRMIMLIRSSQKPEESGHVFGNVYVSVSRNTLERLIGPDKRKKQFRMYSGYAGWSAGQLDREVLRGDWLVVLADAPSIFEKKSSDLWQELFRRGSAIQVRNQGASRIALALEHF
jgi:putative transcriptional regulator